MLRHLGAAARAARGRGRMLELAGLAKLDPSALYRFERGERWPLDPDRVIRAYAELSGCAPIDIWRSALASWDAAR